MSFTDDYDLQPVDYAPVFGPTPKQGQSVPQTDIRSDIARLPQNVGQAASDALGITDAAKAWRGEMTPDEAQMFALGAAPMLIAPEAKALGKVAEAAAPEIARGIRAFHGSPYDFNQFDLSRIGTGEGAQAYGHGLYFAENPSVADIYKSNLADKLYDKPEEQLAAASLSQLRPQMAMEHLRAQAANAKEFPESQKQLSAAADLIESGWQPSKGKMYEVSINADPEHFLDWDKPLSEQHPKVQEALKPLIDQTKKSFPRLEDYADLTGPMRGQDFYRAYSAHRAYPDFATESLRDAGIPGIKYLDQGSRQALPSDLSAIQEEVTTLQKRVDRGETRFQSDLDKAKNQLAIAQGQQKATSNYVVFDDKIVDIVKKYGIAGLVAGGGAHFATKPVDYNPFKNEEVSQ